MNLSLNKTSCTLSVLFALCLASCVDKPKSLPDQQPELTAPAPAQAVPPVVKPPEPAPEPEPKPVPKPEPVKVEPAKPEPAKAELVKPQPIQVEPAIPEPVAEVTVKALEPEKIVEPEIEPEPAKPAVVEPVVQEHPVPEPVPVKPAPGSMKGKVTILGKNAEPLPAGDVIVELEPLFPLPPASNEHKTHEIDMVDKKYTPGVMMIRPGDTIKFHNKDTIKHNVFSSSGNNAFDLGTYGLEVTESTTLKHPGIVKVYCNIHAEMAAFVSVSASGYSFVTQDNGEFSFNNLPAGEYRLKAWHVRGETTKNVQVSAGQSAGADVVINSSSYVPETHLNKFGKPYTTTPTLFKDEFY